ncbi:hypothetical protein T484DRAFT_1916344 [Baffinella frigidus]|nr:hypothetical protein T484DRAFT_1916344 [Cryptophyta sp. CCMP2293]
MVEKTIDQGSSEDEMKFLVACRYAYVSAARLQAWVVKDGLVDQEYHSTFARLQAAEETVTEDENVKLVKMDLADYGVLPEEMAGLDIAALQEMLKEVKGE